MGRILEALPVGCVAKERRGDGEEKVRLTKTKSALKVFRKQEQRRLWN